MVPSTTEHLYTAARRAGPATAEAGRTADRGDQSGRPRGWIWFAAVVGVSLGLWALVIWGATILLRML